MKMHLGFTGTQEGMTSRQKSCVTLFLMGFRDGLDDTGSDAKMIGHHGDCIGADSDFHDICREMDMGVVVHPPEKSDKRAFRPGDETQPPLPYMERNQRIVDHCSILIATPAQYEEVVRSGTWATIRRAKKKGMQIFIFFPDGSLSNVR